MKILITGAGGQLGRSLKALLMNGHRLTALDHATLDITNLGQVREAVSACRPDLVINAAAYTNVDAAETDQYSAFRLNAVGPRNLALAARENDSAILQVSTDYVFDGLGDRPYHEFDPTNPLSIYGKSKLAGERNVISLNRRHYIVRTSWLYSIDGRNFAKTMLAQADRDEVRVVNDQVGSPTYAPHLAAAISRLIETDAYGVYHMAGKGAASWYDLTVELYRACGVTTEVAPASTAEFPRPAPRPRYSVLATLQEPQILLPDWQEGVREFTIAQGGKL